MAIPAFHTSLFALEPHITSDSDGWGMAYGEWLANKLRLLRLSPDCVRLLREHDLSERHARALLRLTDAGMTVYRTDMQGNILITVD